MPWRTARETRNAPGETRRLAAPRIDVVGKQGTGEPRRYARVPAYACFTLLQHGYASALEAESVESGTEIVLAAACAFIADSTTPFIAAIAPCRPSDCAPASALAPAVKVGPAATLDAPAEVAPAVGFASAVAKESSPPCAAHWKFATPEMPSAPAASCVSSCRNTSGSASMNFAAFDTSSGVPEGGFIAS
ncbi:hypothetical protein X977_4688 [Burkholderia pseudomallei MSHR7504]|nr:hypothetical protein X977_4688 [Burkholderia pseudomallei MSHR7504]